jgi:circadian clock protein KaiC
MAKSVKGGPRSIEKTPSGVRGLDEITYGGLPKGRPTLVAGGPGAGKTLLAMEFLIRGATEYNEPGVFVAFEETAGDLAKNVASLGFDLNTLIKQKKLRVDYVYIERSEIQETGEYDLEGLFIRLAAAIDAVGAKRVVLDTIEVLFSGFTNHAILRAELRRLFRWLKEKGVTAIITGERGDVTFTRYGLEEYVADCVIILDHRVNDQISTRRLRVVKYRGSTHGTNEYPFLIDQTGISVLPLSSLGLNHPASKERISTGIPRLDTMLGGKGYYRGSSILISGTAGTGKTSIAASFAEAACRRGERCLYLAMEESPDQITRNMRSIGIDLGRWTRKGLLQIHATRPSLYGLEMHLLTVHKLVEDFKPAVVVMDPVTNLITSGESNEVRSLLTRLMDFLKTRQITTVFTSLTHGSQEIQLSGTEISSLIDTWLLLVSQESNGERNRILYLLKSRGMAHSNQIREFRLTDHGVELENIYVGPAGVLTGTARVVQETKEKAENAIRLSEIERKRQEIARKRKAMEARIALLRAQQEAEEQDMEKKIFLGEQQEQILIQDQETMARLRKADTVLATKRLKKGTRNGK